MSTLFSLQSHITKSDKEALNNHRGFCIWLTGLPSSGKSSISIRLEEILYEHKIRTVILDGDYLRQGLNSNLGFTPEDRAENIRRTAETASLFVNAGTVTIVAVISPYKLDRMNAKNLFSNNDFIEIYVKASLKTCEERDAKGLYEKARKGIIKDFTGISSPYEIPESPDLVIGTEVETDINLNALKIFNFLLSGRYIEI